MLKHSLETSLRLKVAGLFTLAAFGLSCSTTSSIRHNSPAVLSKKIQPLLTLGSVHEYKLKNGLTLLVYPDKSSPTFAYQTWYDVGSKDETPGYTGLAHLFEHMMFKKTKNLADGEFDRILDTAGAEGQNAYTTRDRTVYVQELPKERLELIVQLESDRMQNLVVDDEAFRTEREVVQNERRLRTENNPDGMMYQEIFLLAFKDHPYRWPVIGYQEDLDRMTAKDARNFYDEFYRPDRATIVIAGDVDPDAAAALIEKKYEPILPRTISKQSSNAPTISEPVIQRPREKKMSFNIQIEKILMGFRAPSIKSEDRAALLVLDSILSGGKSARFERNIVDQGIAAGIYSYWAEGEDPSLFLFGATLLEGKKGETAEKAILKELENLKRDLVDPSELKRGIQKLQFSIFEGLNSNSEIANFLGENHSLLGDFTRGADLIAELEKITPQKIQAVARLYFDPTSRVIVRGMPKTKGAVRK
jgi:zinc protease